MRYKRVLTGRRIIVLSMLLAAIVGGALTATFHVPLVLATTALAGSVILTLQRLKAIGWTMSQRYRRYLMIDLLLVMATANIWVAQLIPIYDVSRTGFLYGAALVLRAALTVGVLALLITFPGDDSGGRVPALVGTPEPEPPPE